MIGASRWPGGAYHSDSHLVRRAMARLQEGPCGTVDLASEIFALRGGEGCADGLADSLVASLLDGMPGVVREQGGVWRLARGDAPPAGPRALRLGEMSFAVVDVETTGGNPALGSRILEIGIVAVDRNEIGDCYSTLVDPGIPIPPWITRLTGISRYLLRGSPSFAEVCGEIGERLSGRVFVAHSAEYDWDFLSAEMSREGIHLPSGRRLCTVRLARKILGLDRCGLDSVAEYYGVEIPGRHRAQGDALATAQILVRLLAAAERRGWATWQALSKALAGTTRSQAKSQKAPDESEELVRPGAAGGQSESKRQKVVNGSG